MKGDFTRSTFREKKHYHGVYTQQGRVRLDADGNEQVEIDLHRAHAVAADLVGQAGIPRVHAGFVITPTADGRDLNIPKGHAYVDGILCENPDDITYRSQPDYRNPDPDIQLHAGHRYVVYLDVWPRAITALEDPDIREKALGGPDTSTRAKTLWQVKLAPAETWDPSLLASTGQMEAQTSGPKAATECRMASGAGYSGLENQLYRVEIHRGSAAGKPTMKWSRDNGSVVASIVSRVGDTFTVKQLGPDQALGFAEGQWVELLNDDLELHGRPGPLATVLNPDPAACTLSLSQAPQDTSPYTRMRRWDQSEVAAGTQGIELTYDWQKLECGLEVRFAKTRYLSGDYWLIPARSATRDIEWDTPAAHPPDGIRHHYAVLATLAYDGTKFTVLGNLLTQFPPLTAITAADVSFDSRGCASPSPLVGKQNVQDALASIATLSASNIPFDNTRAQLDDSKTIQQAIDYLAQYGEGCFTLVAHPGPDWQRIFMQIPAATGNAHICLRPGEYTLPDAWLIASGTLPPVVKGKLRITGCGAATHLKSAAKAALVFRGWESVQIEGISVDAGTETPAFNVVGTTPGIWGALTFDDCGEVNLHQVTLRCAAGVAGTAACVKLNNQAPADVTRLATGFRVTESIIEPGNRQIGVLVTNAGRCHVENNRLGASGPAVDASAQLTDPRTALRMRQDLVANPVFGSAVPGVVTTVSFHGQEVRFTTPVELGKAWQKVLDARQLKAGTSLRDLRVSVASLPALVLKSLTTDANVPKELAPFRTWLSRQDATLIDGLQKRKPDAVAKLCGLLMTRVNLAPPRTLASGRALATVSYQRSGGAAFSVVFETASGLQAEWQSLITAEKPSLASAAALLKYINRRAAAVVAGEAALLARQAFANWRAFLARAYPAASSQAIVVAGSYARDVRILNNTIESTLEAIRVALSHTRRIEHPRRLRALPDSVPRLQVSGNTITLLLTPAAPAERCGIFVGNCASLALESNYLEVRRDPPNVLAVQGVKLFGHFGGLVVVRQNHITGCAPEFSLRALPPLPAARQWLVSDNCPPSVKL